MGDRVDAESVRREATASVDLDALRRLLPDLSASELADITAAASTLHLVGDRLPKAYLDLTGR